MTEWSERFEVANIAINADRLAALTAQVIEGGNPPEHYVERLTWLAAVAEHASVVARGAVSTFVSSDMLNGTGSRINTGIAQLEAFLQNGDSACLENATALIDSLLEDLAKWSDPRPSDELEQIESRLHAIRILASRTRNDLARDQEAVRTDLEQLARSFEEQRQAAVDSLTQQLSELRERIAPQEARLDEAIRANQEQFGSAQESRVVAFQAEIDGLRAKGEEQVARQEHALKDVVDEAEQRAASILLEFETVKNEAVATVGAIGAKAMAHGYGEQAKKERKTADQWRRGAVAVGVLVIVVLLLFIWSGEDHGLNSSQTAAKAGVTAALVAVASYAANQARHHRDAADDARRRELALETLPSYLRNLGEEQARTVFEALAIVYFGPDASKDRSDGSTGDSFSLLANLVETLQRARTGVGKIDET